MPPQIYQFVVLGQACSKSNRRQLGIKKIWRNGREKFVPFSYKSREAQEWVGNAKKMLPTLDPLLTGRLDVTLHLYYTSERPDLDGELVFDAMQGEIYLNDRQVRDKHLHFHISKDNPRCEITIRPGQGDLFGSEGS